MAKILVVDDDLSMVTLLRSLLAKRGYEVLVAMSGIVAKEKFMQERPDLVIMDILLPDIDGAEVVRFMLEDSSQKNKSPVIFLTGLFSAVRDPNPQLSIAGQMFPALAKPIDANRLISMIEERLN